MKVNKMEDSTAQDWHESDNKNGVVNEESIRSETNFSISKQDALILLAMASLSLMAALDGTSISVALPVSHPSAFFFNPVLFRDDTDS